MTNPIDHTDFSNAFDILVRPVDDDEDLIGLLAYAFYKKDKQELVVKKGFTECDLKQYHRTLTDGAVRRYREQALSQLEHYTRLVLIDAEPEIKESARTEAIVEARNEIIKAIKLSTSWWLSIVLNVVAWVITLGITALVLFTNGNLKLIP